MEFKGNIIKQLRLALTDYELAAFKKYQFDDVELDKPVAMFNHPSFEFSANVEGYVPVPLKGYCIIMNQDGFTLLYDNEIIVNTFNHKFCVTVMFDNICYEVDFDCNIKTKSYTGKNSTLPDKGLIQRIGVYPFIEGQTKGWLNSVIETNSM